MPSIEQSDSYNERGSIAGELANAALYSAAIEPLKGAAQICDRLAPTQAEKGVNFLADTLGVTAPKPVTDGSATWYAQQFGGAIGSLVPVMLIHQRVSSSAIGAYGSAFKEVSASRELGDLARTAKTNAAVQQAWCMGRYSNHLTPMTPLPNRSISTACSMAPPTP